MPESEVVLSKFQHRVIFPATSNVPLQTAKFCGSACFSPVDSWLRLVVQSLEFVQCPDVAEIVAWSVCTVAIPDAHTCVCVYVYSRSLCPGAAWHLGVSLEPAIFWQRLRLTSVFWPLHE